MCQPARVTHAGEVQPCLARTDEGPNSLMQGAVGEDSMDAERQQGGFYQPSLFEGLEENPRPDQDGEARSLSVRHEEPQASAASDPARALSVNLMEEVTKTDNLNQACRRVCANKGAAGVDGMSVDELWAWVVAHKDEFL